MVHKASAIWKDGWLGHSETFIRDQMNALEDWDFLKLGFDRGDNPLVEPDYAPYKRDVFSKGIRVIAGTSIFEGQYLKRIRESGVSAIHAHFLSGGMHAVQLAKKADLPLITTLHNPRFTPKKGQFPSTRKMIYARRFQQLLEIGDRFLAVSNHVADSAVNAGIPSNRIEVLHIGTHIVPLHESSNPQGIIFVGRLIQSKGVSDLLEAVSILPAPLRQVPVTIIGDGPLRQALQEKAHDLRVNARFLGWVSSAEIPQRLADAQVFCGPSKASSAGTREGFGMVFLEAALQQLPCVAYASGGVRDAVSDGENGILVAEGDIRALSGAIAHLLQDSGMRGEMGKRGRERVQSSFDIQTQSKRLEEIYINR